MLGSVHHQNLSEKKEEDIFHATSIVIKKQLSTFRTTQNYANISAVRP
jgi:hypothetical protein